MLLSIGLFFVFSYSVSAQNFTHLHLKVAFDTLRGEVLGEVWHQIEELEGVQQLVLDARNIEVKTLLLNDVKIEYSQNDTALFIPLKSHPAKAELYLKYKAQPRKGLYFLGWEDETRRARRQIWTQGQGVDHRHWIPHNDDQRDKIIFSAEWIFNPAYEIMSNGVLDSSFQKDGLKHWFYSMKEPMSSYLIAVAIGKYHRIQKQISGINHDLYHYPDRMADSSWYYYQHTEIMRFLEKEIGSPYPWSNYKQAPVMDFRHGAMENTCATIFGDFFLVDSIAFNDRNYTYVDAHEYAHQWFGNLVTAHGPKHHWLHEGFATYYQWLSEEHLYGDDYFFWELQKAKELVFEATALEKKPLADAQAGSSRFYQKGAWLLYMLRNYVGDSVYKVVISEYLSLHAHQVVKNEHLIDLFEKHSSQDIKAFFKLWLYADSEPELKLRKNPRAAELLLDASCDIPQEIQILVKTMEGWDTLSVMVVEGRNRIAVPEDCSYFTIANAGKLLIKISGVDAQKESWSLLNVEETSMLQKVYVLDAFRGDESFLTEHVFDAIILDSSQYHAVRSAALKAFFRKNTKEKARVNLLNKFWSVADVESQRTALQLCLKDNVRLDQEILKGIRETSLSYDSRILAIHLSMIQHKPGGSNWLNDSLWLKAPGSVGANVLQATLFYRLGFLGDTAALEMLLDFASISFDFNTRMLALEYLGYYQPKSELYHQRLWQAFFNSNWKLVAMARRQLLNLQTTEPDLFAEMMDDLDGDWTDFQKRKAARTFSTN